MIISFIGMSGAGKTAWSANLEKFKGFKRFSVDDLIEKRLEPELKALGYSGVNGLSRWLGQPYDERYKINSQRYLENEAESLRAIFEKIKSLSQDINVVVDTTGSVVYLPEELLKILKSQTKVVYLESPTGIIETMIKRYIADPKPVIWGDLYQPRSGEGKDETLKRCYPELLRFRTKLYEKLADIKIDYYRRRQKSFTMEELLREVARQ